MADRAGTYFRHQRGRLRRQRAAGGLAREVRDRDERRRKRRHGAVPKPARPRQLVRRALRLRHERARGERGPRRRGRRSGDGRRGPRDHDGRAQAEPAHGAAEGRGGTGGGGSCGGSAAAARGHDRAVQRAVPALARRADAGGRAALLRELRGDDRVERRPPRLEPAAARLRGHDLRQGHAVHARSGRARRAQGVFPARQGRRRVDGPEHLEDGQVARRRRDRRARLLLGLCGDGPVARAPAVHRPGAAQARLRDAAPAVREARRHRRDRAGGRVAQGPRHAQLRSRTAVDRGHRRRRADR